MATKIGRLLFTDGSYLAILLAAGFAAATAVALRDPDAVHATSQAAAAIEAPLVTKTLWIANMGLLVLLGFRAFPSVFGLVPFLLALAAIAAPSGTLTVLVGAILTIVLVLGFEIRRRLVVSSRIEDRLTLCRDDARD
jgi:hypothetical protein